MATSQSPRPFVFISRAGEDSASAKRIDEILRAEGCETFLQDWDIQPGNSFLHEMNQALQRATHMAVVLSPNWLRKDFTRSELYSMYARDAVGANRSIIAIRVETCDPPPLIRDLVYIDLVGKPESAQRQEIIDAFFGRAKRPTQAAAVRTSVSHLPSVDPRLLGRDRELANLDEAWVNPRTKLVQIVAAGGTGKTALTLNWLRRHIDEVTVFGWSFYSQGMSANRQASSDQFFAEAFRFFDLTIPQGSSVWTRAELLARRLREDRVLLVLDGLEPLQEPDGRIRDQGMLALLKELSERQQGLTVCTSRVRLAEIKSDTPRVIEIDLDDLTPESGAEYLRQLGVIGTDEELRAASSEFGNHALAVTLLGTMLADEFDGDVRRRDCIESVFDETEHGGHARQVMRQYERMYAGRPELSVLRLLGLFDRPADEAAVALLKERWLAMPGRPWREALANLRKARLLLGDKKTKDLDCHPLVREHFGGELKSWSKEKFIEGHGLLYEHYCRSAPKLPETAEQMSPLFFAIYHGCQAGRHREALLDVYKERLRHGEKSFFLHHFGLFATNLSLLANFFEVAWTKPAASLQDVDSVWVLGEAAISMQALGRLREAAEQLQMAASAAAAIADWRNASIYGRHISDILLIIGDIAGAVKAATTSSRTADLRGEPFWCANARSALGRALHQAGDHRPARVAFAAASRMGREEDYDYWELLIEDGRIEEVVDQATRSLEQSAKLGLLSIAHDHMALAHAGVEGHIDLAIEYLRRYGSLMHLPFGLLKRGTPADLEEARTIAERSGMRLILTDYHLAVGNYEEAKQLIEETGYHRRDTELAALGHARSLDRGGFATITKLLDQTAILDIAQRIEAGTSASRGTRNLLDHEWCRDLAARIQHHELLARILPKTHAAIQCTYFEKSTEANWLVPPHQDRCVPVARRVEHPDLGAWSEKEGQLYVVAPEALLEQMAAVRLHLDPCGPDDGPLKIGDHVCLAGPGDAIVMSPLAVHSSSKATGSSRRRVLHFLFGPADPGYGLEWR